MPIRQVNQITNLITWTDGITTVIAIQTAFPASPQLFVTCHPVEDVPKERDRGGQTVPHGFKKWAPIVSLQMTPSYCGGGQYVWEFSNPCTGPDCNFWIAELGTKPNIVWDSVVYPCPQPNPGAATAIWRDTTWGIATDNLWAVVHGAASALTPAPLQNDFSTYLILPGNGTFTSVFASATLNPGSPPTTGTLAFAIGVPGPAIPPLAETVLPIAFTAAHSLLDPCLYAGVVLQRWDTGPSGITLARGAMLSPAGPVDLVPPNLWLTTFEPYPP